MKLLGIEIEFNQARSSELDPYIAAADNNRTDEKQKPPARRPRRSCSDKRSLSSRLSDTQKATADMHQHGGLH